MDGRWATPSPSRCDMSSGGKNDPDAVDLTVPRRPVRLAVAAAGTAEKTIPAPASAPAQTRIDLVALVSVQNFREHCHSPIHPASPLANSSPEDQPTTILKPFGRSLLK